MPKIAIIMGSESDREVVSAALPYLQFFGISADVLVMSAHRTPEKVEKFARGARQAGYKVLIACAGMAAHLAGVVAAQTTLPVIGVPLAAGELRGLDALLSTVQMPSGVPVATMAVGKAGACNAAVLAAQIVGLSDDSVAEKLRQFKKQECKLKP